MNLRMLSERMAMREHKRMGRDDQPILRPVDELAPIITLPVTRTEPGCDSTTPRGLTVEAEVRAKRFHDGAVNDDRYTATIVAQEASAHGLVVALADALAQHDDFRNISAGDPIILEIRLRAS
ncbi:MAG TPA: hypothetical protein VIL01_05710 [Thermomicrobiales bacterium]